MEIGENVIHFSQKRRVVSNKFVKQIDQLLELFNIFLPLFHLDVPLYLGYFYRNCFLRGQIIEIAK